MRRDYLQGAEGVATGVPLCPCPECVRNAVLALGDVLPDAVKE